MALKLTRTFGWSAMVLPVLVITASANASVVVSLGSSGATAWDSAPTLGTATPNATNVTNVGAFPLQQTITVTSSFTLDKLAFVVTNGTNFDADLTLSIYEVADPLAQGFTDKHANAGNLINQLAFDYASAASLSRAILTLDLTGSDEISLTAGKSYVISLKKVASTSNPTFHYFAAADDATSAYTGGAFFYNESYVGADDGQDAAFALYAVPEPASLALIGLGGLVMLPRRRA